MTTVAFSSDPPGNFLGDGAPPPEPCPADINMDGFVDVEDLCIVIEYWGCRSREPLCRGDCNRDFFVDELDIYDVIRAWGAC